MILRERSFLFLPVAAMLAIPTASLNAEIIQATENPGMFGTLDQHKTDCPQLSCGPSAAVNSFVFLQNMYPSIYPNRELVPSAGGVPTQAEQAAVANKLLEDKYMMCDCLNNGTFFDDFIWGKRKYLQDVAPGETTYAAQTSFAWNQGNNQGAGPRAVKPDFVQDSTAPTPRFIANEIGAGEDVEVLLTFTDAGGGGHYITLFGIHYNTTTMMGTLSAVDPWSGLANSPTITGVAPDGNLAISYSVPNSGDPPTIRTGELTVAVGESPIPEPGTLLLLGVSLALGIASPAARRRIIGRNV